MFADPASAVAQINLGRVRPLGVSSLTRIPTAPDIPPIAQAGLPGFEAVSWDPVRGAGCGRRPAIVSKLNQELRAIVASPEGQQQIISFGMQPVSSPSPDELKTFLQTEILRWGKVVQQAGLAGSEKVKLRTKPHSTFPGSDIVRPQFRHSPAGSTHRRWG